MCFNLLYTPVLRYFSTRLPWGTVNLRLVIGSFPSWWTLNLSNTTFDSVQTASVWGSGHRGAGGDTLKVWHFTREALIAVWPPVPQSEMGRERCRFCSFKVLSSKASQWHPLQATPAKPWAHPIPFFLPHFAEKGETTGLRITWLCIFRARGQSFWYLQEVPWETAVNWFKSHHPRNKAEVCLCPELAASVWGPWRPPQGPSPRQRASDTLCCAIKVIKLIGHQILQTELSEVSFLSTLPQTGVRHQSTDRGKKVLCFLSNAWYLVPSRCSVEWSLLAFM